MAALEAVKRMNESASVPRTSSTLHEVEFTYYAPEAKKVCLAGKFNDWNTTSMPMKKGKDGTWRIKMKLLPGSYEYKYFADGAWVQNIPAATKVPNTFGTYNCVIAVQ